MLCMVLYIFGRVALLKTPSIMLLDEQVTHTLTWVVRTTVTGVRCTELNKLTYS